MSCDPSVVAVDRFQTAAEPPGITVFIISATALEAGLGSTLLELLEDQGHEILMIREIERAQLAVVAIDLLPIVDFEECQKYPGFDNPKIAKAIERGRGLVEALEGRSDNLVPLTSTRSSSDAWAMVRLLFEEAEADLRSRADRMRKDFAAAGAIRNLTREGRRAKVELVEFNSELAIRKTYRRSAMRYMEREIEVLQRLSPILPELPKLLDCGPDHIVISRIEDGRDLSLEVRGRWPAPLPLPVVRALADFIKGCVKEGFDPIDLRAPGNVMLTEQGLKVIDFELWRRCSPETRPEKALCLTGVPADDCERPRGVPSFSKPYSSAWYPLTLLSIRSFLYDPPLLQHLKRGANLVRTSSARVAAAASRRLLGRLNAAPRANPRYIPAHLGVNGVIAELNRQNVRYAVLRWFDDLPDLPAGGDLDLLVHDDDIAKVDLVLDSTNGSAQCDVYSVSGLPGTAYSGVPHLPVEKAAELLRSATKFNELYAAPTRENYFLSLAFHSVYHKGFKTGLPTRHPTPAGIPLPKNDYLANLSKLAAELGLEIELTLEGLERHLIRSGWQATPEMLRAWSRRNIWLKSA